MRNKDFALVYNAETGEYVATENKDGNAIFNRIFTAINIQKGTLVCNEEYGSFIHLVKTATDNSEMLLKTYIKECLSPLLNDVQKIEVIDCKIDKIKGVVEIRISCIYSGNDYSFSYWIKI